MTAETEVGVHEWSIVGTGYQMNSSGGLIYPPSQHPPSSEKEREVGAEAVAPHLVDAAEAVAPPREAKAIGIIRIDSELGARGLTLSLLFWRSTEDGTGSRRRATGTGARS